MLFVDFLLALVKDAHTAFQKGILASEMFRQIHFEEKDGVLHPKTTKRRHGDADVEVPDKTQHQLYDLVPKVIIFDTKDTGVDVYEEDGQLKTTLKRGGLFDRKEGVQLQVRMEFYTEEPPEGVAAQRDKMNDRLKGKL